MSADPMDVRRSGIDFPGRFPCSPRPEGVPELPARFVAKVSVDRNGCWLWTASKTPSGYGRIGRGRRGEGWTSAHRFAYECVFGSPLDGHDLDHLCRVRACANPWHVEPVSHLTNVRRGRQANGSGMCRSGRHRWIEQNIYVESESGAKRCRPCRQEWERSLTEGLAPGLRTHCPKGHAYAGDNLHVRPDGSRHCRACHRERERSRYRRVKVAV